MKEKLHAIIKPDCCNTCIHNAVCSYKQNWLDICNALSTCEVVKQLGSQGTTHTKVTLYDILGEVIIKCKQYRAENSIQDYQSIVSTLTNPCDISTSTTNIPRADYIFG